MVDRKIFRASKFPAQKFLTEYFFFYRNIFDQNIRKNNFGSKNNNFEWKNNFDSKK